MSETYDSAMRAAFTRMRIVTLASAGPIGLAIWQKYKDGAGLKKVGKGWRVKR